jgi:UDP-N-acetylglucosamine--N-acetylmuramyl-(pentapeptide) pyrophosphoryl-undecaprenol N-acetylglucosamine transferase
MEMNAGDRAAPGLRLALAGGGTGGHIVPGLHLLAHAREPLGPGSSDAGRLPLADVVWFTSGRAIEERVMASSRARSSAYDIDRVALALEPDGGGAPSRAALALRTPRAVARARSALVRHRSEVLLGLGGFTTLPAVLAARSLGIPVVLLEINARSGAATRWLSRFADRVLHAWPSTLPARAAVGSTADPRNSSSRSMLAGSAITSSARSASECASSSVHRWIGPPLPASMCDVEPDPESESRARAELGFDADRPLLVVLGGSQGSGALNAFLRAHAPALVAGGLSILHQTGPAKSSEACPAFSGYRAVEFIDPVEPALRAASVVLCRGGASTLAEVAAMRRPAFVVPYPHHADMHQEHNARELGRGVRIVPEARLGVTARDEIARLCGADAADERAAMRAALRSAMPTDGSRRLYEELCASARRRRELETQASSRA